jgi:enoyl-CoA hydratase
MNDLVSEQKYEDGTVLLTLNRPDARNAFNAALLARLAERLCALAEAREAHCVIITGAGDAFSAGGDLKEMAASTPVQLWRSPRHGWWNSIFSFPKPLIAAVNGLAYGGGCELALACDIVVAGTNARFALPEIKLGFVPGRGGTQRLPAIVGKSAAMYMVLTGEPIDAHEAFRLGLALEVCEPSVTLDRALAIARTVSARSPIAAQIGKELVQRAGAPQLESGMALERHCYEFLVGTPDAKEGMAAFLERRSPKFFGE